MFKNYREFSLSTGVKTARLAVINTGRNVSVLLHKTVVVEKRGRVVTLRNGGWDTISTRIVINRALEQIASTHAYVCRQKGETFLYQNGVKKPFISGMQIKVRNEVAECVA
jgi:predicted RNase H-like nuclease (RuvC/YqgF family)